MDKLLSPTSSRKKSRLASRIDVTMLSVSEAAEGVRNIDKPQPLSSLLSPVRASPAHARSKRQTRILSALPADTEVSEVSSLLPTPNTSEKPRSAQRATLRASFAFGQRQMSMSSGGESPAHELPPARSGVLAAAERRRTYEKVFDSVPATAGPDDNEDLSEEDILGDTARACWEEVGGGTAYTPAGVAASNLDEAEHLHSLLGVEVAGEMVTMLNRIASDPICVDDFVQIAWESAAAVGGGVTTANKERITKQLAQIKSEEEQLVRQFNQWFGPIKTGLHEVSQRLRNPAIIMDQENADKNLAQLRDRVVQLENATEKRNTLAQRMLRKKNQRLALIATREITVQNQMKRRVQELVAAVHVAGTKNERQGNVDVGSLISASDKVYEYEKRVEEAENELEALRAELDEVKAGAKIMEQLYKQKCEESSSNRKRSEDFDGEKSAAVKQLVAVRGLTKTGLDGVRAGLNKLKKDLRSIVPSNLVQRLLALTRESAMTVMGNAPSIHWWVVKDPDEEEAEKAVQDVRLEQLSATLEECVEQIGDLEAVGCAVDDQGAVVESPVAGIQLMIEESNQGTNPSILSMAAALKGSLSFAHAVASFAVTGSNEAASELAAELTSTRERLTEMEMLSRQREEELMSARRITESTGAEVADQLRAELKRAFGKLQCIPALEAQVQTLREQLDAAIFAAEVADERAYKAETAAHTLQKAAGTSRPTSAAPPRPTPPASATPRGVTPRRRHRGSATSHPSRPSSSSVSTQTQSRRPSRLLLRAIGHAAMQRIVLRLRLKREMAAVGRLLADKLTRARANRRERDMEKEREEVADATACAAKKRQTGMIDAGKVYCWQCGFGPTRNVGPCPECMSVLYYGVDLSRQKRRWMIEQMAMALSRLVKNAKELHRREGDNVSDAESTDSRSEEKKEPAPAGKALHTVDLSVLAEVNEVFAALLPHCSDTVDTQDLLSRMWTKRQEPVASPQVASASKPTAPHPDTNPGYVQPTVSCAKKGRTPYLTQHGEASTGHRDFAAERWPTIARGAQKVSERPAITTSERVDFNVDRSTANTRDHARERLEKRRQLGPSGLRHLGSLCDGWLAAPVPPHPRQDPGWETARGRIVRTAPEPSKQVHSGAATARRPGPADAAGAADETGAQPGLFAEIFSRPRTVGRARTQKQRPPVRIDHPAFPGVDLT
eukprot:TRINITY_DN29660_c0_g1_i2.p1 TRINITY_DN29660_c0_g1~~TRINITY_DN29660_c0_g1_i2.p1  ORF type:complete len:1185 (+),score=308.07 TRINITY_DN29660_c0_g1_i2:53-3607(+)